MSMNNIAPRGKNITFSLLGYNLDRLKHFHISPDKIILVKRCLKHLYISHVKLSYASRIKLIKQNTMYMKKKSHITLNSGSYRILTIQFFTGPMVHFIEQLIYVHLSCGCSSAQKIEYRPYLR